MRLHSLIGVTLVAGVLILGGCDGMSSVSESDDVGSALRLEASTSSHGGVVDVEQIALDAMNQFGASKARPRPTIWADGELFGSVVAPNQFKPTAGNFDELYTGGTGFMNGVPLISESKPGDQDYNGGRWHVNVLKESVDPAKYAGADRVEDLDLADFMSTSVYFSCPMLPRRGRN